MRWPAAALLVVVGFCGCGLGEASGLGQARGVATAPSFDVASVRLNRSGSPPAGEPSRSNVPLGPGDAFNPTGGVLRATNFPLLTYVEFAYRMTDYQVRAFAAEVPAWVAGERFDIEARTEKTAVSKDELRLMMRSLLAERFHLALHFAGREVPVFALVLARPGVTGPKLRQHPAGAGCTTSYGASRDAAGATGAEPPETVAEGFPTVCGAIVGVPASAQDRYSFGARNLEMSRIASALASWGDLGRPVLDRTGLPGGYDFVLEYTPDPPPANAPDSGGPGFREALRQQLGLKLEPQKGAVEFPVLDHVEHLTEN